MNDLKASNPLVSLVVKFFVCNLKRFICRIPLVPYVMITLAMLKDPDTFKGFLIEHVNFTKLKNDLVQLKCVNFGLLRF